MKTVFIGLIIISSVLTNGQSLLTADVATQFVKTKINDLNVKLWYAVKSGEIVAYRNDSMATVLSQDDILDITTSHFYVEENGGIFDSTIAYPDSIPKFEGLTLSYKYNQEGLQTSYTLKGIAPTNELKISSGIDLGLQPIFWVKINDLEGLLTHHEYDLYISVIGIRTSIGDMANPYFFSNPSKNNYEKGRVVISSRIFNEPPFQRFYSKEDSIIAYYLTNTFAAASTVLQQEKDTNIFFKSIKMEDKYVFLPNRLYLEEYVNLPGSVQNDSILVRFVEDITDFSKITITKISQDYIMEFASPLAKNTFKFYATFSMLKPYLEKGDRIVLEALMDEITK